MARPVHCACCFRPEKEDPEEQQQQLPNRGQTSTSPPSAPSFLRCSRCRVARYCSRGCQERHHRHVHRRQCRALHDLRDRVAAPLHMEGQQQQQGQAGPASAAAASRRRLGDAIFSMAYRSSDTVDHGAHMYELALDEYGEALLETTTAAVATAMMAAAAATGRSSCTAGDREGGASAPSTGPWGQQYDLSLDHLRLLLVALGYGQEFVRTLSLPRPAPEGSSRTERTDSDPTTTTTTTNTTSFMKKDTKIDSADGRLSAVGMIGTDHDDEDEYGDGTVSTMPPLPLLSESSSSEHQRPALQLAIVLYRLRRIAQLMQQPQQQPNDFDHPILPSTSGGGGGGGIDENGGDGNDPSGPARGEGAAERRRQLVRREKEDLADYLELLCLRPASSPAPPPRLWGVFFGRDGRTFDHVALGWPVGHGPPASSSVSSTLPSLPVQQQGPPLLPLPPPPMEFYMFLQDSCFMDPAISAVIDDVVEPIVEQLLEAEMAER
jgi:hypothetical protein